MSAATTHKNVLAMLQQARKAPVNKNVARHLGNPVYVSAKDAEKTLYEIEHAARVAREAAMAAEMASRGPPPPSNARRAPPITGGGGGGAPVQPRKTTTTTNTSGTQRRTVVSTPSNSTNTHVRR